MKQLNFSITQRSLGNSAFSDSRKLQNLYPKIQSPFVMLMMTISKPNYFNHSAVKFEVEALEVQ